MGLRLVMSTKKDVIGITAISTIQPVRCNREFATKPKDQPLYEFRFEPEEMATRDKDVLHPDLGSILDADHLRPQAVMGWHGEQDSGQHQVRFQGHSHLRGGHAAACQGEDGIARQHAYPGRSKGGETACCLLSDRRTQMIGNLAPRPEGHDRQTEQAVGLRSTALHRPRQTVTALVDGLNALVRFEPGAQ